MSSAVRRIAGRRWRRPGHRAGPRARAGGAGRHLRAHLRRRLDVEPGGGRRLASRHPRQRRRRQLRRHRLDRRPLAVHPGHRRLRQHRDPVPEPARARAAGRDPLAGVRLPADRGRRHVVHVQPHGRRAAGPRPAALGDHAVEDLHRRHHPLERPGDHRRLRQAAARHPDHPGRPLRRCRRLGAVHQVHGQPGALDLLPRSSRASCTSAAAARASPSTRRSGARRPRSARTASPTTSRRRTAPARSATSSTPTPSGSTSR